MEIGWPQECLKNDQKVGDLPPYWQTWKFRIDQVGRWDLSFVWDGHQVAVVATQSILYCNTSCIIVFPPRREAGLLHFAWDGTKYTAMSSIPILVFSYVFCLNSIVLISVPWTICYFKGNVRFLLAVLWDITTLNLLVFITSWFVKIIYKMCYCRVMTVHLLIFLTYMIWWWIKIC